MGDDRSSDDLLLPPRPDGRRIRVELIGDRGPTEQICRERERMSRSGPRWNDLELTWEDEGVDFFVVVNLPWPGERYDPARTVALQLEPWCGEAYQTWGVKTWGEWADPDPARFLHIRTHRTHVNAAFWQLAATCEELRTRPIRTGARGPIGSTGPTGPAGALNRPSL